jgi:hypothetical protein
VDVRRSELHLLTARTSVTDRVDADSRRIMLL